MSRLQDPTAETPAGTSVTAPLTVGLVLTVAAVAFEALAVPTIMPAVLIAMGDLDAYGWIFSIFLLTNVIGTVAAGGRVDRGGPLGAFVVGMLLFAAGLALAGVADGTRVLIAARAVQGLGGGALSAVVYASVARRYPEAQRPRMLAILSTAWVVPGLVGPALAGVTADHVGWRVVFVGLIPLLGVASMLAVPALRRLPRPEPTTGTASHLGAAVLVAVGIVVLLVGLEGRGPVLPCLTGGGLVAGLGLRRLMPAGTFTLRAGLPAAIAVMGLVCAAFFGAEAGVPLLATTLLGQSSAMAGLTLTGATLTWTAGAWLQARLVRTRSRRVLVAIGCTCIASGIAGIAACTPAGTPIAALWIAWSVTGLGMGLTHATVSLVVLEEAPAGGEGTASAALQLANVIGAALGTGVLGALLVTSESTTRGLVVGLAVMAATALAGGIAAARLPRAAPSARRAATARQRGVTA